MPTGTDPDPPDNDEDEDEDDEEEEDDEDVPCEPAVAVWKMLDHEPRHANTCLHLWTACECFVKSGHVQRNSKASAAPGMSDSTATVITTEY